MPEICPAVDERDRTQLEQKLMLLALEVAKRTAQARREMPSFDLTRTRRIVDAAIALEHAAKLLSQTVGLEELAADERSILAAAGGDTAQA